MKRIVLALAAGLMFSCGGPGDAEPVFPTDYRTTFVEVRNCRPTVEHSAVHFDGTVVDYIRVLANDVAAAAYLADDNPLPVGSIVVKEGYVGTDCGGDDGTLSVITAMLKEPPGFDAQDADWHWQVTTPNLRVMDDTKNTCITCHRVEACTVRDYMCTVP